MEGTTWIALHPVPTTATRLPRRSTSWRHSAVWKAGPAKLSRPGRGGTAGTDNCPQAVTSTSASWLPAVVSSTHLPRSSSQLALSTSVFVLMPLRTPYSRATFSR